MGKLQGRVAIITGAARGQGEATARIFAGEGARVVLVDMLEAEGEAVAASIGEAAMFRKLDVSDEDGWNALVAEVKAKWGTIDILINNAGIVHPAKITELRKDDYERVLRINLIGSWLGMKTVAPVMEAQGKGAIVNVCSTSALQGFNGLGAYLSSKWALRGLTKTAAMELARKGIRVNAVFPGGINTPMGNVTGEAPEELSKYYQGYPIRRIGEPEEVARANLFLASDDSSFCCGAEVTVDGGQTIGEYSPQLPGFD
jgi:3alpha(or 20beta)-hydroxysteroid dehydrogenase